MFFLRKTLEKPKRGLRILKIKVRELITHREGISTPHTHHKGRQPLIECANYVFSPFLLLLFFLFFLSRQGCYPCSYVSPGAMRKSDLRSSLSLNVCVLN